MFVEVGVCMVDTQRHDAHTTAALLYHITDTRLETRGVLIRTAEVIHP